MKKAMILSALLLSSSAFADDRTELMASNCAGCHGTDGIGGMVNIAGLKADVFADKMQSFRNNESFSTVMHNIALSLPEEDVDALAKYFEALPTGESK